MNTFTKKLCAALTGGLFLLSAVGCNEEKTEEHPDAADEIGNLALEDMPYGASVTQLKPSLNDDIRIAIEYDNRYLTLDEAVKLSNYVSALNDCDGELLEQTFYKPYLDKIVGNSGFTDIDEYVTSIHDNIRDNYIGYDFTFDYVLTESCLTESDDDAETGFSSIDAMLDELGDETVSDKVTSRKLVTFDLEYKIGDAVDSYMLSTSTSTSSSLYIYTIDGQTYII